MSILEEISAALQRGKRKEVTALVQQAIDEGQSAQAILQDGLLAGMSVIGGKFKNNEVFVPEVLVAARCMNAGSALLKDLLAQEGAEPLGTCILGTVKGDLHDIGKNIVRMMVEGKGINVIDLGVDVESEKFVECAKENNIKLILCSALLTTTMPSLKDVIDKFTEAGMRDQVKIMIGGAPVTQSFADSIGADAYTPDAASCAEKAAELIKTL